jgi:hypothetical protein
VLLVGRDLARQRQPAIERQERDRRSERFVLSLSREIEEANDTTLTPGVVNRGDPARLLRLKARHLVAPGRGQFRAYSSLQRHGRCQFGQQSFRLVRIVDHVVIPSQRAHG